MKLFYIALIVLLTHSSWAQDPGAAPMEGNSQATPELPPPQSMQYPAVRPKPPDDPNKESSSFIGDPENIDPLNSRRDNLKDDAEPVLEDIRQVLDAPPPQKEEPEGFQSSDPQPLPKKKVVAKKAKAKKSKKASLPKKAKPKVVRNADDPDEAIERSFYDNYMRYNSEPTSVEAWSTATFGRSEEVYIVQKGDTLWSISETLFGDSLFWPKIWALNRQGIVNPHFITPGMKVRFFPGSPDYVPTLAVGGEGGDPSAQAAGEMEQGVFVSSEGSASSGESSSAESSYRKPSPLVEYGEFVSSEDRKLPPQGVLVAAEGQPTPLPPSLPVYRSSRYFDPVRKVEVIDLKEREKLYVQPYVDVFLTDRLVLSDLKISREGNNDLGCNVGEVLRNFEFIRKTPTDEYTILEALEKITLEKNFYLYPYRKVGTLSQYAEGKLRIKDCNSHISRNHLFVPTSVVPSLKTRKTSDKQPRIIGGATLMDQMGFHEESTIFVDMGTISFEIGQTFGVISERIDAPAGQFKIMDRFGSYAAGIITNEAKPIMSGDRVVSQ